MSTVIFYIWGLFLTPFMITQLNFEVLNRNTLKKYIYNLVIILSTKYSCHSGFVKLCRPWATRLLHKATLMWKVRLKLLEDLNKTEQNRPLGERRTRQPRGQKLQKEARLLRNKGRHQCYWNPGGSGVARWVQIKLFE